MPRFPGPRGILCAALVGSFGPGLVSAAESPPVPEVTPVGPERVAKIIRSAEDLKGLPVENLKQLFSQRVANPIPPGFVRGRLLVLSGYPLPRLSARVGEVVWKEKRFEADGSFFNQWLGFQAMRSKAVLALSWYDGQPCLALEYPPGTPLLANMR